MCLSRRCELLVLHSLTPSPLHPFTPSPLHPLTPSLTHTQDDQPPLGKAGPRSEAGAAVRHQRRCRRAHSPHRAAVGRHSRSAKAAATTAIAETAANRQRVHAAPACRRWSVIVWVCVIVVVLSSVAVAAGGRR